MKRNKNKLYRYARMTKRKISIFYRSKYGEVEKYMI
jgi:hypothetical protein